MTGNSFLGRLADRRRQRALERATRSLDDHMLRDMGLSRDDATGRIHRVAHDL